MSKNGTERRAGEMFAKDTSNETEENNQIMLSHIFEE